MPNTYIVLLLSFDFGLSRNINCGQEMARAEHFTLHNTCQCSDGQTGFGGVSK